MERLQICALDRAATDIGCAYLISLSHFSIQHSAFVRLTAVQFKLHNLCRASSCPLLFLFTFSTSESLLAAV
jgi:hypothetical protein